MGKLNMLVFIKKVPFALVVLAGFGCDESLPDEGPDVVIDRVVLQQEVDELQASLSESDMCMEDGVALDAILGSDGDDVSPERRLAAELMEAHLADGDGGLACGGSSMGALAADPDVAAGCEFENTNVCTNCIAGFSGCNYCFTGSWYCPIFGCELVVSSCEETPELADVE
ncbi:MAG: hypothetical protein AB1Z98_22410 [Nannocystaceae bacterium]